MSGYYDAVASGQPVGVEGAWQNAIDSITPGAGQAAAQTVVPGDPDYIAKLFQLAQAYVTTDAQRRLLNIQLERARRGEPPLDSSQYGLGVNVGLSPQTLKTVGMVAAGLGLLYLIARKR